MINDILIKACDGAAYEFCQKPWYFWLATGNFEEIHTPTGRSDERDTFATEAPVKEFSSPYLGQDLKTLAKKLWDAPDDVWLNRVWFAVMDERTGRDGSLLLCHVEEDGSIDTLRAWPKHSSLYFRGMKSGQWEELKHALEMQKKRTGDDVLD